MEMIGSVLMGRRGEVEMKCWDCPHFKIQYEPIRANGGGCWDLGRAKCNKYDLIVDFPDHRKLKKLQCVMDAQRLVEKGTKNDSL